MNDEQHDEMYELSGLYALDALEPADRARFEEHLETCRACRQEVAAFRETASYLIEDDVSPPVSLRESILSQLDEIPQEVSDPTPAKTPGSHGARRTTADHPDADDLAPKEASGPVTPLRPKRRRRFLAGVAGFAVAASIGVFTLVERPWQPDEPPLTPEQEVIAAQDAERFEDSAGEGEIAVVYSPSRDEAVLESGELEPPPEGHAYQAWYLHAEADPVSAGMLPSNDEAILLDGDPAGATGVALTIEPDGGSPQPTTEPVYVVELS